MLGDISDEAIRAASASGIALFRLPQEVPLVQVERAVIRLIVDRVGYIAQRSSALQHDLNQIALDGGGLEKIAPHIALFAQQPFILLRDDGQVAVHAGLDVFPETRRQSLLGSLPNQTALRSWVATQSVVGGGKKVVGILPLNSLAHRGRVQPGRIDSNRGYRRGARLSCRSATVEQCGSGGQRRRGDYGQPGGGGGGPGVGQTECGGPGRRAHARQRLSMSCSPLR